MKKFSFTFQFDDDGQLTIDYCAENSDKIRPYEVLGALDIAKQDVLNFCSKSVVDVRTKTEE